MQNLGSSICFHGLQLKCLFQEMRKSFPSIFFFKTSFRTEQYNLLVVNMIFSMSVSQFSKQFYVSFLHVKRNLLVNLLTSLHEYISVIAIGYNSYIIFKMNKTQAVRLSPDNSRIPRT